GLDPDDLAMVERGAGGDARAAAEQPDLPEVRAASEVLQHHLAAREALRHLHEPDADQVEGVGLLALADDDLPGFVANELDAVTQVVDEVVGDAGEHRHAAEVRGERALPVAA